ncbi:hypothetical protein MPF19_09710 [Polaribacter sp. Z014]|uniref:hypothetical protein n=1 Tax=Polaribacter sp. Z014 TaxID=2927126 RepID=UPI00201FF260|nr:hypothetical protein [Polaribacter sp. Z014]MCL7763689.1 hypothetical protein [Polaribacter sp. Z014]
MIKKIICSFLFLITISAFSQQEKINNYKYVIVPERFDFLKTPDQYQTSSLTKFLLKKKGFDVFLSNEKLPQDLMLNRCKALTAIVIDDSSMFTVKSKIEMQDCNGNVLYSSELGKSKEKDYKKSYQEAIRDAYDSMVDLEYNYTPLQEESIKDAGLVVEEVLAVQKMVSKEIAVPKGSLEVLYSQAKKNGFQLVDTTPAVVFQILKTNVKDVFVIKDKNGIIYKNGNNWVAEYYENEELVIKHYVIKF